MTPHRLKSMAVKTSAALIGCAAIGLSGPAAAQTPMCLPVSPAGLDTGVSFQGSSFGGGSFTGVTVTELRVPSISATIANRAGGVLFDGPLFVGQTIPLPTYYNLVWTGTGSRTHMRAACFTSNF